MTWSSWLLAVTLLFSPLWFNPFAFEMEKVGKGGMVEAGVLSG